LPAVIRRAIIVIACGFEHYVANMFFLSMGVLMKLAGFAYTDTEPRQDYREERFPLL
jgi:formate/nitrite transporter FocA (FNT family)